MGHANKPQQCCSVQVCKPRRPRMSVFSPELSRQVLDQCAVYEKRRHLKTTQTRARPVLKHVLWAIIFTLVTSVSVQSGELSSKASELLDLAWACPPSGHWNREHLAWGVVHDRNTEEAPGNIVLVDHETQTLLDTETNIIRTINVDISIEISLKFIKAIRSEGEGVLRLTCQEGNKCITERVATSLSTDCEGFCAGQPWRRERKREGFRIQFCGSETATSAGEAIRQSTSVIGVSHDPIDVRSLQEPYLVCWVTNPKASGLNVREKPGGRRTGKVLRSSMPVLVKHFHKHWDDDFAWAIVPGGYSVASLTTCEAPELYQ